MPTLSGLYPCRHRIVQAKTVHTRNTSIRPSERTSEDIHVHVSIDAGYDTNFNAVGMSMSRENMIADMAETKKKRNPRLQQSTSSQHTPNTPRGTVAADMHRSPGLDHPTSFLPGGDPTPWPRSESQFSGAWRQRICWRCEQSIFIGKSLHHAEPIIVLIQQAPPGSHHFSHYSMRAVHT